MRVVCFEIEVTRNSLNPYCGRVQCLSTDVVRLSLDRCYGLFMVLALELGWDARTLHGGLNDLVLGWDSS
jgi:hypothetical protein